MSIPSNIPQQIAAAKGDRKKLEQFSTADLVRYCESELIRVIKSKRRLVNAIHRFWEYESTDESGESTDESGESTDESGESTDSESESSDSDDSGTESDESGESGSESSDSD